MRYPEMTKDQDSKERSTRLGERHNTPPEDTPVIRSIAMPADTNPDGDIFGGWLMAQMDLAAGNVAARRARGRCATVTVEGMTFHSPVFVGDEVSLYAKLLSEGRTSMRIKVEAWRRRREEEAITQVTEAIFTFVAIDKDRRPTPLPAADDINRIK